MTNQQGASEALRHASYLEDFFISEVVNATRARQIAAELRRLHAENERLAALVEAQQPAPSAAAMGDVDLPDAEDMAHSAVQEALSFGLSHDVIHRWMRHIQDQTVKAMLAAPQPSPTPQADSQPAPIDMVLHCPKCGLQHIDAPEKVDRRLAAIDPPAAWAMDPWTNEPHRSHLCHGCGHIWRPADVPTNGVAAVKTTGKADSPIAARASADSQPAPPKITAEDRSFLHYNPNTDDIVEWVQNYANASINADRAARAAPQPATADAVDAARYRHIRSRDNSLETQQRDKGITNGPSCYHEVDGIRELKWGVELDAAIDAALAAQREVKP